MAAAVRARRIRDKHDPMYRRPRKSRMTESPARGKVVAVVGAGGKSTSMNRHAKVIAVVGAGGKSTSMNRHAKVIAVVGAGGKSTYIDRQAEMAVAGGLKAAVTTTTHIYDPRVRFGMQNVPEDQAVKPTGTVAGADFSGDVPGDKEARPISTVAGTDLTGDVPGDKEAKPISTVAGTDLVGDVPGDDETKPVCTVCGVDFFGVPDGAGRLGPVSRESFSDICRRYDIIFVEADGSRCMPAKIPSGPEPVLPKETDEVVVVMGKAAVGRPSAAVIQHYSGNIGIENFGAGEQAQVCPEGSDAAIHSSPEEPDAAIRSCPEGSDAAIHSCPEEPDAAIRSCPEGSDAAIHSCPEEPDAAIRSCKGNFGTAVNHALFTDPLTEESLRRIAFHYYIQPIRRKFPNAKITYYLSNLYKSGRGEDVKQVTFVLMASGFGRRYSAEKNKLLEPVRTNWKSNPAVVGASKNADRYGGQEGKVALDSTSAGGERLFERAVLELSRSAELLRLRYGLKVRIAVVTRYQEIMDWCISRRIPDLEVFQNPGAKEGITSSIRIGARAACAAESDAVIYFAADMPRLTGEQIARFTAEYIFSGRTFGCMAYRDGKDLVRSIPGAFRLTVPSENDLAHMDMQSLVRFHTVGTSEDQGNMDVQPQAGSYTVGTAEVQGNMDAQPEGGSYTARPVMDQLLALHGDRGAMKIIRRYPWDTYLFFVEKKFLEDIDYQEN